MCVFISNSFVSFYETSAISLAIDPKNDMIIGVSTLLWKIVVFRTLNERSVKTFAWQWFPVMKAAAAAAVVAAA